MDEREIDKESLVRTFTFERAKKNDDGTLDISFSSETDQVERWFGVEILDHSAGAMAMDRAKDGLPFLVDHGRELVGRVSNIRIDSDRKGRGTVTFSQSARAQEVKRDMEDGIRPDTSFGYRILKHEVTKGQGSAPDVVRVTSWMPYEISTVGVPADASVGVGRSLDPLADPNHQPAPVAATQEVRMEPETKPQAATAAAAAAPAPPAAPAGPTAQEVRTNERQQVLQIRSFAEKFGLGEKAESLLTGGKELHEVRDALMAEMAKRQEPIVAAPESTSDGLGLTEAERGKYSIGRAVRALINQDFSKAGFELEVSRAMSKRLGQGTRGIFVPSDFQVRSANTLNTQTVGKGKEAVYTEYAGWIQLLRNRARVFQLGGQFIPGLRNNYSFVRQNAAATVYWVSENPGVDVTESTLGFQNVVMTPHTLKGFLSYTAQQLAQAEEAFDALVEQELLAVHALEIDRAALMGTGASGQPTGILNTAGIGAVALGTNGLAIPGIAPLVDLESQVTSVNADMGKLAYLTDAYQRGVLRKTQTFGTGTALPVWGDNGKGDGGGNVNGYRAEASNQLPGTFVKGSSSNCHALIFANWADLMVGEWGGGLELVVDPYTLAGQDITRVISRQLVDVALRHVQSFAAIKDAL